MFERFRRFAPKVFVFVFLFFGEALAEAENPRVPAIRLPVASDADVQRAFPHWQQAYAVSDREGAKKALATLLQLKAEIGANAAARNFAKWNVLNTYLWPNPVWLYGKAMQHSYTFLNASGLL